VNHVLQEHHWPPTITNFFSLNNPLVLALFMAVDIIPSWLGHSANMRVMARRV
jgi:hypothetical protein